MITSLKVLYQQDWPCLGIGLAFTSSSPSRDDHLIPSAFFIFSSICKRTCSVTLTSTEISLVVSIENKNETLIFLLLNPALLQNGIRHLCYNNKWINSIVLFINNWNSKITNVSLFNNFCFWKGTDESIRGWYFQVNNNTARL